MTVNADMEQAAIYTDEVYGARQKSARQSAREIVPLVLNLIKPQSVIDVGCGVGTWLSVFKEYGVENFLGVDGDWLDKRMLEIPEERFLSFDLNKPFYVDKTFDLVVSLEVAEHLLPDSAETFIDSLTQLAPVILFSAAIPHQGGTSHINERWPDYWTKHFGLRTEYRCVLENERGDRVRHTISRRDFPVDRRGILCFGPGCRCTIMDRGKES